MIKKINSIFENFDYLPIYSKILRRIEVKTTHGDNFKIKKFLKNFKFSNFDVSLIKTINWYNKNKINKIT